MKTIIANWKCNPQTLKKARALFGAVKKGLKNIKTGGVETVVCPPFLYLQPLKQEFLGQGRHKIKLGAQNVFWESKGGAFTGEISVRQLEDANVRYALIGHSERRNVLKETNAFVRKKVPPVLKTKIRPVICVGETAQQKKQNRTFQVLNQQLRQGLKKVPKTKVKNILIAYEPLWAIGSGHPCPASQAVTCLLYIKKVIGQIFSKNRAEKVKLLYGGSATPDNAQDYLKEKAIHGLLVGGASLKPDQFLAIIKIASEY